MPPIMMPFDAIVLHPRHEEIFGKTSEKSLDLLRASILARGILEPIIITPPDAVDHPNCAVNGNDRVRIGRELALPEVPVLVDDLLRTEAQQIEAMFHYAQRKDFTWGQRAKHADAVRKMLAALPPADWQKRGYQGKDPAEIVAIVVRQPRRNVFRMQAVFDKSRSTDELMSAVDEGRLSLYEADLIIQEAERRRASGSRHGKRLINELLERALRERQARKNTRTPRTQTFDPAPKPTAFLREIQKQLHDWALGEIPATLRHSALHAPLVSAAVKDFMVEIRAAGAAFKMKVRRITGNQTRVPTTPLQNLRRVNDALQILGLRAIKRLDDVDLDEVRRTHRVMARAYHPDLNDEPTARDKFERVHGAYERILEICDGR